MTKHKKNFIFLRLTCFSENLVKSTKTISSLFVNPYIKNTFSEFVRLTCLDLSSISLYI